jgi:PMC2NT (NUC016) domain
MQALRNTSLLLTIVKVRLTLSALSYRRHPTTFSVWVSYNNIERSAERSIMDNPQELESLQGQIREALLAATKTTNRISSEDLSFQRSLDPTVGTALDEQSARLLALSRSLLKSAATISDLSTPTLQDIDDVDNNWKHVVDIVDSLLEKADICLDEYTGVIKRKAPTTTDQVSLYVNTQWCWAEICIVGPGKVQEEFVWI